MDSGYTRRELSPKTNAHVKRLILENFYLYLSILVFLIFVLSIGVTFYYLKYKRVLKDATDKAIESQEKEEQRVDYINESLRIISLACIQEQCEVSEACIRIRMLITRVDHIPADDFPYIFEMYEKIKHFKTHEARKAMNKQERYNEDKLRFKMEAEFGQKIKEECEALLSMIKSMS